MIDYLKKYIYRKKLKNYLTIVITFLFTIFLGYQVEFDLFKIINGIPSMLNLFKRMLVINPDYITEVYSKLIETVEIACISSLIGIIVSLPLSIFVSKNIAPSKFIWRILNLFFAFFRTIPSLVWAAILVSIFSIGKFSGILALSITASLASLKLFKDYIESIPNNILNSAIAVGASKFQVLKFCVFPTIIEQSFAIFFMVLEINIRGATILGFVGAGGIGQIMWRDLNHLRYDNLATLILLLFITIFIIDFLSLSIRKRFRIKTIDFKDLNDFKRYKKIKMISFVALLCGLIFISNKAIGVNSERIALGLSQTRIIVSRMFHMDLKYMPALIKGLKESLAIAIMATILGGLNTIVLTYFSAYNISANKYSTGFMKLFINILRTFPSIVLAIIFFRGVGPGPLAGVLALTIYTTGVMTKLYSEVIESLNENLINSVRVTGSKNFGIYRWGIIPETFPNFISLLLYRLESNMRTSTILGIIGAGGVGTALTMNITWRNWERVGLLIFGIAITVFIIDLISNGIRKRFI